MKSSPTDQDVSFTTLLEKQSYLDPQLSALNFSYGYPEGLNPDWITHYQTHPEKGFLTTPPIQYITTIKNYFEDFFQSANITLVPTCTQAFSMAVDALLTSADDEVIMLDATYDSHPYTVRSYKGRVVYAQRGKNNTIDIESIKEKYTPHTKAIVLCCPENPLGVIYSRQSFEQVITFCKVKGLTLLVDNCFAAISPFGKEVTIVSRLESSVGLSYLLVGDTGKILGLKGTKLGAIIFSEDWREILEATQSICFFQYNQYDLSLLAAILSDTQFPEYLRQTNQQIAKNYFHLKNNLDKKIKLMNIEGSCFCLIDIQELGETDLSYAASLMKKYSVILIPASFFHTEQKVHSTKLRISLARSMEDIKQLTRLLNNSATQVKREVV